MRINLLTETALKLVNKSDKFIHKYTRKIIEKGYISRIFKTI